MLEMTNHIILNHFMNRRVICIFIKMQETIKRKLSFVTPCFKISFSDVKKMHYFFLPIEHKSIINDFIPHPENAVSRRHIAQYQQIIITFPSKENKSLGLENSVATSKLLLPSSCSCFQMTRAEQIYRSVLTQNEKVKDRRGERKSLLLKFVGPLMDIKISNYHIFHWNNGNPSLFNLINKSIIQFNK